MRVAILSPTDFSLFARLVADFASREPGMELCAVVARRTLAFDRVFSEVRRDGWRLLRKFWRKAVMGGQDGGATGQLAQLAASRALGSGGLRELCRQHDIPHIEVQEHNDPRALELLQIARPDVIAFAGGGILRQPLLDVAPHGVLNTHMGVLPRFRGMDVVEWALLEGRPEDVGITTHRMEAGLDTGPIHRTRRIRPLRGETIATLRGRMEVAMVEEMEAVLRALRDGASPPRPQRVEDGRQYFVVHPRLTSLLGGIGRAGTG